MPIPAICLQRSNYAGAGGIGGGGGTNLQGSLVAGGMAVSGAGFPVLSLATGMKATFAIKLTLDMLGQDPIDLSTTNIVFKAKDDWDDQFNVIEIPCSLQSGTTDTVLLQIKKTDIAKAGIYQCFFACYDKSDGAMVADYRCLLSVMRGPDETLGGNSPITAMDIRMVMRDASPDNNLLIQDLEFSDVEIYFAMIRAVDTWNETPPLIAPYTVSNFPFKEAWRRGTAGFLLETAAMQFMRNQLSYNAGGMQVNDQDKSGPYLQLASKLQKDYKEFVLQQKYNINMAGAFGTIGSGMYQQRYRGF